MTDNNTDSKLVITQIKLYNEVDRGAPLITGFDVVDPKHCYDENRLSCLAA